MNILKSSLYFNHFITFYPFTNNANYSILLAASESIIIKAPDINREPARRTISTYRTVTYGITPQVWVCVFPTKNTLPAETTEKECLLVSHV